MSPDIDDEDEVEEGQLTSPGRTERAEGRASESPIPGPAALTSGSEIPASDSPAKSQNRFRSRSRSRSRRRRSGSRSKRRRSGSRSRSPYAGPVIRDMRRGRKRNNRIVRGRRPFRNNFRRSFSRSRTPSPARGTRKSDSPAEPKQITRNGRRETVSVEKGASAAAPEVAAVRQLRPEDIKNQAKADTMSFLAMLNEKKQVNKNLPNNLKSKSTAGKDTDAGDGHNKSHGFVSTFASLAGRQDQASGDEDDGWEVVDDAAPGSSGQSPVKKLSDQQPLPDHKSDSESRIPDDIAQSHVRDEVSSQAAKSKDKKKKKSSRREESKKKKRKDKKRRHSDSGSGDESDDPDHKKYRKRKRSASPTTKSPGKVCKSLQSEEAVSTKEAEEKRSKKERKEKKKSKHSRRSVSVSDSERISRKKSKKKKSKKSSSLKKKKRKSSPSSDSSDSGSQAVTMEIGEGSKKKQTDGDMPCVSRDVEQKSTPSIFQFPRSVLMYTQSQPSIQYSRNPRTILLNPADDSPCVKILPADPPTRLAEHRTPEKRSTEKMRTCDRSLSSSVRQEQGSPQTDKKYSDSKKDDDHNRDKKVSSSGSKSHQSSKSSKHSDRNLTDSSLKRERSPPDKAEDKSKLVASVKQELLEKAAQKKKDSAIRSDTKDLKILNDKIVIGKIKQSRKADRRSDKATPTDMNQDYAWYQQQYATSYSMDPFTAAYYAQYAMLTSNDYSTPDITAWLKGYGFAYDPNNTSTMQLLPPTSTTTAAATDAPVESSIPVLTKPVPDTVVEQYFQTPEATVASVDTQPEEMDVESGDDDCPSPPVPPPPPPLPPQITSLVVEHAFTLPNGQEVPAGTKQVIVHPYPESHPLSSHFTPEFVQSAVNSLQSPKFEEKSGRIVSNGSSNSTSVVT